MPVKVALFQFSEKFQGHQFFPYSAGLLQAYAQRHLSQPWRFSFLPPVYCPESISLLAARYQDVDVAGFSVYVWNLHRSLALAQTLKLQKPSLLIIFGGPQIPNQAEQFLRAHPWVDVCCHGPGEAVLTALLEAYPERHWDSIEGISYLNFRGEFIYHPPQRRSRSLADIPLPYHTEVFQPLLRAAPQTRWIAPWETNRGCPFSCTFCDWGSAISTPLSLFELEQLYQDLEWFGRNRIDMVFCCDANFGILKRDLEIAAYAADVFQRTGFPHTFHQQTSKNTPERTWAIHQIFARAGMYSEATLSLQSMDPHTLRQVKRENISLVTFLDLQRRFLQAGIPTYTDMILGLPGETYASFTHGIEQIIANGQHSRMQFYNVLVLPNAEMGQPEYRTAHGLETVMVNLHPENMYPQDVVERGEIVIATSTMPREDWLRARVFAWMTKFLYFIHKPLQIPLLILKACANLSFQSMIEAFTEPGAPRGPVLNSILHFFQEKARNLQAGISDICWFSYSGQSEKKLPLPPEQFQLAVLCQQALLDTFYQEAESLLLFCVQGKDFPAELVSQAVALNAALFKISFMTGVDEPCFPFHQDTIDVYLSHNLLEVYQALLQGQEWNWCLQPQRLIKSWSGPPFILERVILPMAEHS